MLLYGAILKILLRNKYNDGKREISLAVIYIKAS